MYFALIQEIPQQVRQQLRPKPKSSGLGMEANLDFHDKNFFQCSNISKQGAYLQVDYRAIVKNYFRSIQAKSLALAMVKSVTFFLGHPVYPPFTRTNRSPQSLVSIVEMVYWFMLQWIILSNANNRSLGQMCSLPIFLLFQLTP